MPIRPPAPPRLSTTNCWPRISDNFAENTRAVMSLPPPGANGTITRTGLVGYCWAWTGAAAVASRPAQSIAVVGRKNIDFIQFSPRCDYESFIAGELSHDHAGASPCR